MLEREFDIGLCGLCCHAVSVRPSVCPSRSWITSKRINIYLDTGHWQQSNVTIRPNVTRNSPTTGVSNTRVSLQMTLSDLAKYSMTWSIAQPLCDSWASLLILFRPKISKPGIVYVVLIRYAGGATPVCKSDENEVDRCIRNKTLLLCNKTSRNQPGRFTV